MKYPKFKFVSTSFKKALECAKQRITLSVAALNSAPGLTIILPTLLILKLLPLADSPNSPQRLLTLQRNPRCCIALWCLFADWYQRDHWGTPTSSWSQCDRFEDDPNRPSLFIWVSMVTTSSFTKGKGRNRIPFGAHAKSFADSCLRSIFSKEPAIPPPQPHTRSPFVSRKRNSPSLLF